MICNKSLCHHEHSGSQRDMGVTLGSGLTDRGIRFANRIGLTQFLIDLDLGAQSILLTGHLS